MGMVRLLTLRLELRLELELELRMGKGKGRSYRMLLSTQIDCIIRWSRRRVMRHAKKTFGTSCLVGHRELRRGM